MVIIFVLVTKIALVVTHDHKALDLPTVTYKSLTVVWAGGEGGCRLKPQNVGRANMTAKMQKIRTYTLSPDLCILGLFSSVHCSDVNCNTVSDWCSK